MGMSRGAPFVNIDGQKFVPATHETPQGFDVLVRLYEFRESALDAAERVRAGQRAIEESVGEWLRGQAEGRKRWPV